MMTMNAAMTSRAPQTASPINVMLTIAHRWLRRLTFLLAMGAMLPAAAQIITTITGNGVNAPTINGNDAQAAAASVGTLRALAYDASGNLYFSERYAVRKISTTGVLTTIAGGNTLGATGDGGQATAALFTEIRALAVDSVGNIYIAEARKIRKITVSTGVITLLAGNGACGNGTFTNASNIAIDFCGITGMGFDSANNLYVADLERNASIIRRAAVGDSVSSFAVAPSCFPIDVKVSPNGFIVAICRSSGSDQIRRYNSGGGYVDALTAPTDLVSLAIDAANNIYASTASHNVYSVTAGGNVVGNGVAGFSGDGGAATSAQLNLPVGLAIHPANLLTIADTGNFRLRRYLGIVPAAPTIVSAVGGLNQATVTFTAPAANGGPAPTSYTATCGSVSVSGAASPIVVAPIIVNASVACSVTANNSIGTGPASTTVNAQVFTHLIHTIAGTGTLGFGGDGGQAVNALLAEPTGITVDTAGNLIVSDFSNNRVRKINPVGIISTIAGTGVTGSSGDGGQAISAQLNRPVSAIFDSSGNLYVSEFFGARVRKITPAGIISTIAGTGVAGFSGDGGQAVSAQLFNPIGMAFDSTGNLYFAERQNNRVRKITMSTGVITTVAGNGSNVSSGDGGQATSAGINTFGGIAIDSSNNLFIADHNHRIRRVTPAGVISTVVGTGVAGFSGDGGQAVSAQINAPYGIRFDASGNLFIGSTGDMRIRMMSTTGVMSTIAGNGTTTRAANGATALSGAVLPDMDIAFDALGNLYFASFTDNHVRKITRAVPAAPTIGTAVLGNGQVFVHFTPAPFNGGAPVSYLATCGAFSVAGSASPISVGGQTNGVSVQCSVQATNYLGNSVPSALSNSVRPNDIPFPPAINSVTPGNGQVTVVFTQNTSGTGSIDNHRTSCGAGANLRQASGLASPHVVYGLTNGIAVTCVVRAENNVSTTASAPSASVTPATVPDAPIIGVATLGNSQVSVAFSPPASNGGAAITSYTATCGSVSASGATSPVVVTGLANGVSVSCSVNATNSIGTGAASAQSNSVTLNQQFILFGAAPTIPANGTGVVTATGGASGNPVIFTSTTPAVCVVRGTNGSTVVSMNNGTCIVAANQTAGGIFSAAAEVTLPIVMVYPQTTAVLSAARAEHSAVRLSDGRVLVAGGRNATSRLTSVEIFNPATNNWSAAGAMALARSNFTATLLPNGRVLVAGGVNGFSLSGAEIYDPATNAWTTTASMAVVRHNHTATLLTNGQILVAGGFDNGSGYIASAELYNPATGLWSTAGAMNAARANHAAIALANGEVLQMGGGGGSGVLSSVERYSPTTNTWSASGTLLSTRYLHTATLFDSGKILLTGGHNGSTQLATSELFDVATNTSGAAASMIEGRDRFTATLLPNGRVLVAGGFNNAKAEFYDPLTDSWTTAGLLLTQRLNHSATLLQDGRVLLAGGFSQSNSYLASAEMFVFTSLPGIPAIGTATAGLASATVSFTPPYNIGMSALTSYTALSAPGGLTGSCVVPCNSINVTGLSHGTAYTFTVAATNQAGSGLASAPSNSVTTHSVPSAPTSVVATAANAQVSVAFAVPASNGGTVITGYTATCGTQSNSGAASPIVVTGLTNGVAVSCTVLATNAVGNSVNSAASNSVTPLSVPDAPTNVVATAGIAQVSVAFAAPGNNGGSAITSYTATCGLNSNSGAASPIIVTGLVNAPVTCTVTATNVVGTSAPSAASNSVTPVTVADAPTNVNVQAGNGSVTVSFSPPIANGGSAITSYTATCGAQSNSGATSPIVVTGLTNGVAVTCSVVAINVNGNSAASMASLSIVPSPTWRAAGTLSVARASHVAVLLADGSVLAIGGVVNNSVDAVDRYNPATNSWQMMPSLITALISHRHTSE